LNPDQGFFGVSLQKAIVPNSPEALGQGMLEQQSGKFNPLKGPDHPISCLAVLIAKGDLSMLVGEDIVFRNHPSIQISRKIFQGGLSFSGELTIDHPFDSVEGGIEIVAKLFQAG